MFTELDNAITLANLRKARRNDNHMIIEHFNLNFKHLNDYVSVLLSRVLNTGDFLWIEVCVISSYKNGDVNNV